MVELSHWRDVVVPQRNYTGCIPTGYEWLIRYLKIEGIDLDTFQEDFDLQRSDEGMNDFGSVATKIREKYPQINIRIKDFPNGKEKVEFVKRLMGSDIPCLLSIANTPIGVIWHIVPVVSVDDTKVKIIWTGDQTQEFTIADVINRHDNWIGGKDISWIEK